MSTKEGQTKSLEWRRSKVLELSSEGYCQREIAQKLQIGKSVVNRDVLFLRKQARENLQHHIHDKIPEEYQSCMAGINRIIQLTWEIAEKPADDKTRLQAFAQLNEGYKFKMDLTTNGVIITDAIKFVQTNKEKLMSNQEDNDKESEEPDYNEDKDQLEEKQEEETGEINRETTNQVF